MHKHITHKSHIHIHSHIDHTHHTNHLHRSHRSHTSHKSLTQITHTHTHARTHTHTLHTHTHTHYTHTHTHTHITHTHTERDRHISPPIHALLSLAQSGAGRFSMNTGCWDLRLPHTLYYIRRTHCDYSPGACHKSALPSVRLWCVVLLSKGIMLLVCEAALKQEQALARLCTCCRCTLKHLHTRPCGGVAWLTL